MKIRRDIASIPVRSAHETWAAIVDLVIDSDSVDADQLDAAASIMESLIADEQPATVPIVFKGSGPRVLVYCLYNEEAMDAGSAVDALNSNPTAGNWRVTAPCEAEDVDWMSKTLKERAARITVHDVKAPPTEDGNDDDNAAKSFEIDWKAVGS